MFSYSYSHVDAAARCKPKRKIYNRPPWLFPLPILAVQMSVGNKNIAGAAPRRQWS